MASLLQKSTPWIEDSFVYACSFDASRSDEEGNGSDSDFNDNDEEMEPQTENTIPAGLHDDDDDSHDGNNGRNKPPPSRGGKIVQIIDRGGDPNFYVNEQQQQQQQSDGNNNNDCCPPYLILHDGQYSTIAFLSEEAYNSSMMRQDVASRGTNKQPKAIPRKSLISISQYTISTIKCCAQHNNKDHQQHQPKNDHNEDILPLQLVRPDMPRAHLSQVQMSLNTNLLLSLYLLGPITLIGAENQGLIGNTINVNCSIKVRRVLISHMAQFDRVHKEHTNVCVNIEEEEEEEDYQHWTMVQRLEACHCYYQLLKERQGGTIPMWPWESRLVGGERDDDGAKEENDSANDDVGIVDVTVKPAATTTAIAASPGRVERMIQKYENLEELLREDDNEEDEEDADVAEAVAVGDKRAGRASTGTYLAKWDSEEEQVEEEEEEVDDTADAIGDKRAARASTGTYLAKWDSEEDQEEEEAEEETKGNAGEQVQQQHHEAEGGEGEENEKDTHAKKDDTPIEQGNVAELFDNFDDINDVLDLEEDEPVIAREGEHSTSANAMLDSNKTDDGIDIDNIESNATEQGEENETTEENEEYSNTQDDNAATFVGIDQMFVESDDDEEEEAEEEEDEEEQAPLLTQQEFNVYRDEETEPVSDVLDPPQEVTESQIPLPPVKVSKQSTKLSREDGLTREYVESQIPLPPPKDTQSSDENDGGDIGTESQIPVPSIRNQLNKRSADESASEDEKDGGDIGTKSQIPFPPRRKPHAQSLAASDSEDEESDGDIGAESQIPFPPRIKQHTESLDRHTDDEEGTYPAESQVLIPQKQSTKTAGCSPRKPIADAANIHQSVRPKRKEIMYDSDDDWMRIRKVKPTAKPTKRAPRVQSQIAGEGSEENFPANVLDTSQIGGNNENEAEEEEGNTGISEKEMQQPSSISTVQKGPSSSVASARSHQPAAALSNTRTTDHRVRFAIDDTDQNEHSQALPAAVTAPALPPPPVINQRELFISVSNKASTILFQSSMACNELASRKRKASEDEGETKKEKKKFSFGTLFDRAKRLWPSHPDDEEEDERQQQV